MFGLYSYIFILWIRDEYFTYYKAIFFQDKIFLSYLKAYAEDLHELSNVLMLDISKFSSNAGLSMHIFQI